MNHMEDGIAGASGTAGAKGDKGDKGDAGVAGSVFATSGTNVGSDTTVLKADVVVPTGKTLAVGDYIIDVNGELYQIKAVTNDGYTVGGVVITLKGAQGAAGTAGVAGAKGDKGDAGAAVDGVEFTVTKDANGAITAIAGKYKLAGEKTATHDITCTIADAPAAG